MYHYHHENIIIMTTGSQGGGEGESCGTEILFKEPNPTCGTGISFKEPNPTGSRPSELIGHSRQHKKPHPSNTQGKARRTRRTQPAQRSGWEGGGGPTGAPLRRGQPSPGIGPSRNRKMCRCKGGVTDPYSTSSRNGNRHF